MNRRYYGKKTLQCQEIVGLEASNFRGKVLQIWMHLCQHFIIYEENSSGFHERPVVQLLPRSNFNPCTCRSPCSGQADGQADGSYIRGSDYHLSIANHSFPPFLSTAWPPPISVSRAICNNGGRSGRATYPRRSPAFNSGSYEQFQYHVNLNAACKYESILIDGR
jgi:hypothetical protein